MKDTIMKFKHNTSATAIINIVAKDPNATGQTLYDYFMYYQLGEPDERDYKEFQKKLKKV